MGRADSKFRSMIAVVRLLRENATIKELGVEEKIFPLVAPEGTDGDSIVYARIGYERRDMKMGISLQRSVFLITVVSTDYDRSLDLAEAVYETLEGDHSDFGVRIRMEDYVEDYVDKKYFQNVTFSIE